MLGENSEKNFGPLVSDTKSEKGRFWVDTSREKNGERKLQRGS